MTLSLLDPNCLQATEIHVQQDPFPFLIAANQLPPSASDELARDFPRYNEAGFFPWDTAECGPAVNALIEQLTSAQMASAIGSALHIDELVQYPTLVTICRYLNKRHGTIHTDSKSKVATALLYLSPLWPDTSDGCLRFLNTIDNIDDLAAPEIKPLYGTLVAFKRGENSFHGHLPHEGERPVIQVAWLISEAEKLRKTQRGGFSRSIKKLLGKLDRKLGAGRDRNAAHRD